MSIRLVVLFCMIGYLFPIAAQDAFMDDGELDYDAIAERFEDANISLDGTAPTREDLESLNETTRALLNASQAIGTSFDDSAITNFDKEKMKLIMDIYQDTSFGQLIDVQAATGRIREMQGELDDIIENFSLIEQKKIDVDDRYVAIRNTIYDIIGNTVQLNESIQQRLHSMNVYSKRLYELRQMLATTGRQIQEGQIALHHHLEILYAIYNELYNDGEQIDTMRLFVSSDDIAATLADETTAQALAYQIGLLTIELEENHKRFQQTSRHLYNIRDRYRQEVAAYRQEVDYLEQQRGYLHDFFRYLEDEKVDIDIQYTRYLNNKITLQNHIDSLMDLVTTDWSTINWDGEVDITPLIENPDRPDSGQYFDWPVKPLKITAYFSDQSYREFLGVEHLGVDFRAPQGSNLYAPADGIVYKIVDSGGPGLSWMIMLHPHGYITVYLHISAFTVEVGDYVRRGDLIGKNGGTPGTRGAGFMTTGPHLHREVYKNGEVINPLLAMDLSVMPSPGDLPAKYKEKYYRDSISMMSSSSVGNQIIFDAIFTNFYLSEGNKSTLFAQLQKYVQERGDYYFWLASALMRKESNFYLYYVPQVGFGQSCDAVYTEGQNSSNSRVQLYINAHASSFDRLNIMGSNLLCSFLGAVGPVQYLPRWLVAFLESNEYDVSNFATDKDNVMFWYDIVIDKMQAENVTEEIIQQFIQDTRTNVANDRDIFDGIPRSHPVINFLERYNGGSNIGSQTLNYATITTEYLLDYAR